MKPGNYLYRAPLLDGRPHIRGYKLAWQHSDCNAPAFSEDALARLLALVARD